MTRKQHLMLRHAIGLGAANGSGDAYRNHYVADPDSVDCVALVDEGLFERGRMLVGGRSYYFNCTDKGIAAARAKYPEESADMERFRKVMEFAEEECPGDVLMQLGFVAMYASHLASALEALMSEDSESARSYANIQLKYINLEIEK